MTNTTTAASHVPRFIHLGNRIVRGALRIGMPMGPMILLTVRGRKTGLPRTTHVGLFELGATTTCFPPWVIFNGYATCVPPRKRS